MHPHSSGFGFVVMEEPQFLVDWRVTRGPAAGKNPWALRQADRLMDQYRPDAIVLEEWHARGFRRCARIRQLLRAFARHAVARSIEVRTATAAECRAAFAGKQRITNHELAALVAQEYPELSRHLPPVRKLWMSEDRRISLFWAAALATVAMALPARKVLG
jgi:hypothetical protein